MDSSSTMQQMDNTQHSSSSSDESSCSLNLSLNPEERLSILVQKELIQQEHFGNHVRGIGTKMQGLRLFTGGTRDRLVTAMSEWCSDCLNSSKSLNLLLNSSAKILDSFLWSYHGDTSALGNLEPLAVTCVLIAAKSRKIRINTNTLLKTFHPGEIEAWEKLVLTKLGWEVNYVIPQDYLNPLIQFQQSDRDSSSSGNCGQAETKDVEGSSLQEAPLGCSQEEEETPAANNQCHTGSRTNEENVLTDADLISGFCYRCGSTYNHPPRLLALCCLAIADNDTNIKKTMEVLQLTEDYSVKDIKDVMDEIQQHISQLYPSSSRDTSPVKKTHAVEKSGLQNTTTDGVTIRHSYADVLATKPTASPKIKHSPVKKESCLVPTAAREPFSEGKDQMRRETKIVKANADGETVRQSYAEGMSKTTTPHKQTSSPFKSISSSTPKAGRNPLSPPRSGNLLVTKEPIRTLSKPLVEGGFCEDFENLSIHGEENKENNDSAVGGLLGTPVRSPKEHKDGESSKQSSPGTDSGASSADSPPSLSNVPEDVTSKSKPKLDLIPNLEIL